MARGLKKFVKANNFPWTTLKKYWKFSSCSELIVDVLLPVIFSIATLYWTSKFVSDFGVLIEKFQDLSGQIIAAISILAGFNITSITVISATGGYSDKLRKRINSAGQTNIYNMLIAFFTWAVVIQLIVVLLSILLFYTGSFIPKTLNYPIPWWGWMSAGFWLTVTIHSIFISIRNIKTLYLYVTYEPKEKAP